MKKVIFVGFELDYEQLEVASLTKYYQVKHVAISRRVKRVLKSALFFNKALYYKLYSILVNRKIDRLPSADLIITTDNLRYISSLQGRDELKLVLFRNTFDGSFLPLLNGFHCYTFDSHDAKKYDFCIYNQFASGYDLISSLKFGTEYDITFVGRDKGRAELLSSISEQVFPLKILKKIVGKRNVMTYIQYLNVMLNSHMVLDIVNCKQVGETMRLLEALLAGRKVVTNNQSMRAHPLYNPNNILIFDNVDELAKKVFTFYNQPFDDDVKPLLEKYSPRYVLGEIIENCCKGRR